MESNNNNNTARIASIIALIIVAAGVGFYTVRSNSQVEEGKEMALGTEEQSGVENTISTPVPTPVSTQPTPTPTKTPSTTPTTQPSTKPTPTPAKTTKYKNGTYTASGVYATPEGGESIDVTLTIKDDVIVDSNVTGNARMFSTSGNYQRRFIADYKPYVVGRKLDSAQLSAVSGASLTSNGFNAALAKIKAQAQA